MALIVFVDMLVSKYAVHKSPISHWADKKSRRTSSSSYGKKLNLPTTNLGSKDEDIALDKI